MRRRVIIASTLSLVMIALVVGMSVCSTSIRERERAYFEDGAPLAAPEMLAVDLSMWWNSYGWVVGPVAILAGLGWTAYTVSAGRRPMGSGSQRA